MASVKGFFKNWIVRNLLLAALFVLALVLLSSLVLSTCTRHGQKISVPDFRGMSVPEAAAAAADAGITVVVTDSVYVRRMDPGAVYMQIPKAGSDVKAGRKIRLTTNTMHPSEVYMPSLVGSSLRQAKSELERSGLELGRLIYVRDMATNYVLRQQYRGTDVAPGAPLSSGTAINLVLGLSDDDSTAVPDVTGVRYRDAVSIIQDNSLNIGSLHFDSSVRTYSDSLSALVYAQSPRSDSLSVRRGTGVSLSLTVDEDRLRQHRQGR